MSDIKNLIKEKKQQNNEEYDKKQEIEEVATKKKGKEEKPKTTQKDENWNEDVFPDHIVNVKNINELRAKKTAQQPKGSLISHAFSNFLIIKGHGTSGWETVITKTTPEEETSFSHHF